MKHFSQSERLGVGFLMVTTLMEALVPLFANQVSRIVPPVSFLLIASIISLLVLVPTGVYPRIFKEVQWTRRLLGAIAFIALVLFIYYSVIFIVGRYTTSINTALILRAEIITTLIISTLFFGERISKYQLLGVFVLFIGTLLVLFQGSFVLNIADLSILGVMIILPFMNKVAQRVLQTVPPLVFLAIRYISVLPFYMLLIWILQEDLTVFIDITLLQWGLLLLFSVGLLLISKICWFEGIKRLPLGESVYISSATPVIAFLLSVWLLSEIPTWYQIVGCILTVGGILLMTQRDGRLKD